MKTNHVNQAHRPFVDVKYKNGVATTIVRDENGMLNCICGRGYGLVKTLQRHVLGCNESLTLSSPPSSAATGETVMSTPSTFKFK